MEDYYQQKGRKVIDFLLGFIMNFGIALAVMFGLGILFVAGLATVKLTHILIISITIIGLTLLEISIIRKYLKQRRYIAIGLIVGIVFPLLVVGTCSPLIFSLT
ncbi:hypothetical protein BC643_0786 [Mangrovibacterium diazotrophicum]|uniref:Uncharacterized protein n=2 Tax=Mangrovibacterium diazotrophicum TaxID=1261403 RepID=A0A419W4T4_9BACT|nr:hypothetical protein BC643_0786 [Mangrovibacterium diazotrophicum]